MLKGTYKDLSGRVFKRLLVVRDSGERSRSRAVLWECLCECGNIAHVQTTSLLKNRTRSCGCLQREHIRALNFLHAKENAAKGARRKIDPEKIKKTAFGYYVSNAKSRGLEFGLTFELAMSLFSLPCNYCGASNSNTIRWGSRLFTYNGIDRVDSTKGYLEGNVVPCCSTCNLAKGIMSGEEFISWAVRVAEYSRKVEQK